jgi:hypothetical protein
LAASISDRKQAKGEKMSGPTRTVNAAATIYTGNAVLLAGRAIELPADHAEDLAASGHVMLPAPAKSLKVEKPGRTLPPAKDD